MNKAKRVLSAALAGLALFLFSGCTLITVNPDKDNAQVIATIDGQDIRKEEFNNYMAYLEMQYHQSGQDMPTGKNLKTLKESVYDSIVMQDALSIKAEKDGMKVDKAALEKEGQQTYDSLKKSLGEAFDRILEKNYVTEEQFESFVKNFRVKAEYVTKLEDEYTKKVDKDPKIVLDEVVGKIGDTDVTRGEYYYYLLNNSMTSALSGNSSSSDDKEKIFSTIELNLANIQYCEDNNIKITDENIKKQQDILNQMLSYMGLTGDQLTSALKQYYMTNDIYKGYQKEAAKAEAAKNAILEAEKKKVEVSDSEIKKYYDEHKDEFDESTASAMHILTDDKNLAEDIYERAKNLDKAGFEKLMNEYKKDSNVKEATDLGSFDRNTMVSEFSDAVFSAEKNSVIGPILTDYGYHVIYVYDLDKKGVKDLDSVKDEIKSELTTQKAQESYNKIETKLGKEMKIDIYDFADSPLDAYAQQIEKELNTQEYKQRVGL